MGKSKKRNRRQALIDATKLNIKPKHAKIKSNIQDDNGDEISDNEEITNEAIQTTIQTINYLTKNPDQFHSKQCKGLRKALHPLILQQIQNYDKGIDYRLKTTNYLSKQSWHDALSSIQGVIDYKQPCKQGTIQRWVRFIDDCDDDFIKIKLFGCILSCSNGVSDNKHDPALALIHTVKSCDDNSGLKILEGWTIPESLDDEEDVQSNLPSNIISKVLYHEKGSERKPPNHHDLLLHTITTPISLSPSKNITKHDVPFIPNGFVLSNVFTDHECKMLIHIASTLGYKPDHPTSHTNPTGIDSCEWFIDNSMHDTLFNRVKEYLPSTINNESSENITNQVHGINKRWRFFKYGQNCVYRPHIDGSWPDNYIKNDKYEIDESGSTKSYLTFLIYLNDDFDGGETRFYYPVDCKDDGTLMVARGVIPRVGCVLVFPQGNIASLLHEGSAVTKGTKYVIRTDVLYCGK